MKTLVLAALAAVVTSVAADTVVDPPLTPDTAVGVWEALQCQQPATLWRMELNKTGDSYLVQLTVGTQPIVRRLLSSEIIDGKVKLHFGRGQARDLPGETFSEIWIIGTGDGTATRGGIDAADWHFVKGAWTRDVGQASEHAEEAIREASSKK